MKVFLIKWVKEFLLLIFSNIFFPHRVIRNAFRFPLFPRSARDISYPVVFRSTGNIRSGLLAASERRCSPRDDVAWLLRNHSQDFEDSTKGQRRVREQYRRFSKPLPLAGEMDFRARWEIKPTIRYWLAFLFLSGPLKNCNDFAAVPAKIHRNVHRNITFSLRLFTSQATRGNRQCLKK